MIHVRKMMWSLSPYKSLQGKEKFYKEKISIRNSQILAVTNSQNI